MLARPPHRLLGAAATLAITASMALTTAGSAVADPYTPGAPVVTGDTTPSFTLPAGTDHTVTVDGQGVALTGGATVDLPELAEGDHELVIAYLDGDGARQSVTTRLVVDVTAPRVTLRESAHNRDSTKVRLTWTTSEPAAVYGSLDGAAPQPLTGSALLVRAPFGAHRYEVFALDAAGNRSDLSRVRWTASDRTPPVVTGFDVTYNPFDGRRAWLFFDAAPDVTEVAVSFDGTRVTVRRAQGIAEVSGFTVGTHTFVLAAKDAAGNVTKVRTTFVAEPAVVYSDIPASRLAKGIKAGSRRADVAAVQAGLEWPADVNPGVYDRATVTHVTAWQKRNHLYATGVVNALTWRSMVNGAADRSPRRVVTVSSISAARLAEGIRMGDKGQAVVDIQRLLGVKETGTYWTLTTAAVKAFQKKNGLAVTGVVNATTWRKLVR
ncbi:peptidoglycan-binding domain-containing protein [Cellulomonas massiliensis]|uniref:peptidoglycan-binding domain-containing protein n=1 Tax=Cellulomonas massiliensis TaxID=1465811 RepID=UPI0002EAAFBE|nr:peptidoglycan-binding protein [Cellulomonas massiliensis]